MTTESFSPDMKKVHNLAQRLVQLIDKHLASLEPISGENDAALLAILIRSLTTFKVFAASAFQLCRERLYGAC